MPAKGMSLETRTRRLGEGQGNSGERAWEQGTWPVKDR